MKGDIFVCKQITVVSTPHGQPDRRIQIKIEDLDFTGENNRRIGQLVPAVEREAVVASLEKIKRLRLKEYEVAAIDEEEQQHGNDDGAEDELSSDETENGAHQDESNNRGTSKLDPKAKLDRAVQSNMTPGPGSTARPKGTRSPSTSPTRLSHDAILSSTRKSAASEQMDTQIPSDALQTQAAPQARKPVKRTRGGYSMGREGFEAARGDNLAGPQAPTLQHRRESLPSKEPNNKLLNIINNLPGQAQKRPSPEPSAPVSAQRVTEDIVVETPSQPKRTLAMSTAQASTQPRLQRYRVPADQRKLLDDVSSWLPSATGQEFPHPNVPIELLKAWNIKAMAPHQSSQMSHFATIERSSAPKSIEEIERPSPKDEAMNESSSDSDGSDVSEDELLPWSQSPSQRRAPEMLPPDSSGMQSPTNRNRPASKESAAASNQHAQSPASGSRASLSAMKSPVQKDGQTQRLRSVDENLKTTPPVKQTPLAPTSASSKRPEESSSSILTQASGGLPKASAISHVLSSSPAAVSAMRATKNASQQRSSPISFGRRHVPSPEPRCTRPLADNAQGPIRPSTQATGQVRESPQFSGKAREHLPTTVRSSRPISTPKGPGLSQSQRNSTNSGNESTGSGRKRPAPGEFYRPAPRGSGRAPDDSPANASQPPDGTSEMEAAVPRALNSPANYRQARRDFYRGEQRKQW